MQNQFTCEVCLGKTILKEFDYPIGWEKRLEIEKRKLSYGRVLRNNAIYLAKIVISRMPALGLARFKALRKRAALRQWLSRSQLPVLAGNLQYGASFFQGKKIRVCQTCGFGAVFPPLNEQTLLEYYSSLYWLAVSKSLEPCENPRTTTIYKIVKEHIPFERVRNSVEFGSASAQLSRYFKQHHPHLEISVIEPAENWQRLLRGHVKLIFRNIHEATGTYDLLLSSHSLEHVPDIQEYFRGILNLCSDDSYLIFEVPNSKEADVIFDKTNGDYHIPHTYFFTPTAFKKCAERYDLELLVMKTFNRSYSQILNNIQNGINGTMENPNGAYLRVLLHKKW